MNKFMQENVKKNIKGLGILSIMLLVVLSVQSVYASTKKMSGKQKKAYAKIINSVYKEEKKRMSELDPDGELSYGLNYTYFDINKDGTKELITHSRWTGTSIYTYKKGKSKKLGNFGDGSCVSTTLYNDKYILNYFDFPLQLYDRTSSHFSYENGKFIGTLTALHSNEVSSTDIKNCKKYKVCDDNGSIIMKDFKWKNKK